MAWTEPKTWARLDPLNADNLNTYVRDNQAYLKSAVDGQAANLVSRVRSVSPAAVSLSSGNDVFGSPELVLTVVKSAANLMAGCQVSFQTSDTSSNTVGFELRLRCYQATPAKTVDVYLDSFMKDNSLVSLMPSTVFLGFAAGEVTFTAGGPLSLAVADHVIWAMEL